VKGDGTKVEVKVIGPGSFFGEIGLVTGSERTANVIAKTRMRLLRLSKEDYNTYLSHFADADNKFSRMALEKVQEQLRNLKA
jgi:CRP/FNR family cyclic AMP-dependent transcriptional regulator